MGDRAERVDPAEQAALLHALRVTAHAPDAAAGAEAAARDTGDQVSAEGTARGAPRRRVDDTPQPQPGACVREMDAGAWLGRKRAPATSGPSTWALVVLTRAGPSRSGARARARAYGGGGAENA
jgi:hypothetical protein